MQRVKGMRTPVCVRKRAEDQQQRRRQQILKQQQQRPAQSISHSRCENMEPKRQRNRLSIQEQLDVIRDVKLGMTRSAAMQKYGIRHHSTLSQIIQRRGHQVKVVRAVMSNNPAAAAALQKARTDARLRCVARKPVLPALSHTDPLSQQPVTQPAPHLPAANASPAARASPLKIRVPAKFDLSLLRSVGRVVSFEQKIDDAISRLTKLNQRLIVRKGVKVLCTCCQKEINHTFNTVVARVREHSLTRTHTENIARTRQQRQLTEPLGEEVNGSKSPKPESHAAQMEPVVRNGQSPAKRAVSLPERVNRFPRQVRASLPAPVAAASVLTAEEKAKRQEEFNRELVQTFLEVGIPVHKLNMSSLRNFFQKWTGMQVPRYEEESLDYGF